MKDKAILKSYKQYSLIVIVFIVSCMLFFIASQLHSCFNQVVHVASYLTWHNLFESFSILVCFAVFVVSYYTYDQNKNFRSLLLGCVFLFIGFMDLFHTLSYKGMPEFFVENLSANRATTFWIISRLFGTSGIVIASFLPVSKRLRINKRYILAVTCTAFIVLLIAVTYCPEAIPPMYVEGYGLTNLKIYLEYLIIILLFMTILKFINIFKKHGDYANILLSSAMLLNIFSEFAFVSYGSVYDIYNYLGHIYKAISFYIIFRVIFIQDIQKPYYELFEARNKLREHAENLDREVEERTNELKRINQNLLDDLEYARDIQKSMLPLRLPDELEVSFDAKYFPAERVSGDFYNVIKLDERNVGIYIGDVSGHGVPAAMLTVFVNQTLKTVNEDEGKMEILSPSVVLKNLYMAFNKTNFKDEVYIVMFYGIFNLDTKELVYSSAGMNVQPMIISQSEGIIRELEIKGFPICKFMEFFQGDYQEGTIRLYSGDKLLFYTDGLIENENKNGEAFLHEQLLSLLSSNTNQSCKILSEIITGRVFEFIGSNNLKDDITLLVMQVN